MTTPPDYPDFHQPTASASADSIIGTPLAGSNLPASSTITAYSGPIASTSYAVAIDALCQASPGIPFLKVSMIWKDAQGGNVLDIQHWFILATNVAPANGNCLVVGRGPTVAGFLTILIKNYDSAAMTLDFELIKSSRVVTRHDWRSVSNNISGSYTYNGFTFSTPVSDPPGNLPGCSPGIFINAPAGTHATRVEALYAGQTFLAIDAVSTGAALAATVQGYTINVDFGVPAQEMFGPISLAAAAGVHAQTTVQITRGRAPILLDFINNGTAQCEVTYSEMVQEFAT